MGDNYDNGISIPLCQECGIAPLRTLASLETAMCIDCRRVRNVIFEAGGDRGGDRGVAKFRVGEYVIMLPTGKSAIIDGCWWKNYIGMYVYKVGDRRWQEMQLELVND